MSIVNIEGYDGLGKTTLINQLKEKYPSITRSIAFPTPDTKKRTERMKKTLDRYNIQSITDYHYQFINDFKAQEESIKKIIQEKGPILLLLDRYIYSNAAYLGCDYFIYLDNKYKTHNNLKANEKGFKMFVTLMSIASAFYDELIQPDLVIYLYRPDVVVGTEIGKIQGSYEGSFKTLVPKDLVQIEGLKKDTFSNVEEALKQRGYL